MASKLNINNCSVDDIKSNVAMLGDEKADALVRYRDSHGGIKDWSELKNIPGFSDKLAGSMSDFFTLGSAEKVSSKDESVLDKPVDEATEEITKK